MNKYFSRLTGFLLIISFLLSGQIIFAQEQRVFFGNLHSHTSYSDGSGTPREAYVYARDTALIDFLALTEHNHAEALGDDRIGIATNNALYKGAAATSLISTANALTRNGRFVALYGQEFSTISSGNHVNVFDVGEVINLPKGRFDLLMDFLRTNRDSSGQPAIIMFNHPENSLTILSKEYGLDDFNGEIDRWITNMGTHARLIQMINGPGMNSAVNANSASPDEDAYLKYLNVGYKLAPTADQDNHKRNWGNATHARTAVVAAALTKADVLGALRSRHVYATEDKNLSVVIKVNNRLLGDVVTPLPPAGELNITYSITDADEPSAEYEIQVWRDAVGGQFARMVSSVTVPGGTGTMEDVAFSGEPQYFFFKLIQRNEDGDADRVWTAPIWFENQSQPADTDPTVPVDNVSRFVASRRSEVFHVSDDCLDARQIKDGNRIRGAAARAGRRLHDGCPRRRGN
jgi:hypothetical protein